MNARTAVSRCTLRAMPCFSDIPRAKAGRAIRRSQKSILNHPAKWRSKNRPPDNAVSPAIDEILFRRGHKYVTVVIGAIQKYTIDVEPNRNACRNPVGAETAFRRLFSWMQCCRLQRMKDAAGTLLRHRDSILASFMYRIINAILRGHFHDPDGPEAGKGLQHVPWFRFHDL